MFETLQYKYTLFGSASRGTSVAWNYSAVENCQAYNKCGLWFNISARTGTSYSLWVIAEKSPDNINWTHFGTCGLTKGSAGAVTSSVRAWYEHYDNIGAFIRFRWMATSDATTANPVNATFQAGFYGIQG